ncbi:MAG: hypothetical protein LBQ74_13195 [Prevotella sp.]|nr:hypothetical protein [Prevotella sp.]
MNPKELKPDKKYRYTGGIEPVEVTYLYETINRYMFRMNDNDFSLSVVSVKLNVEEISTPQNCDVTNQNNNKL